MHEAKEHYPSFQRRLESSQGGIEFGIFIALMLKFCSQFLFLSILND